MPRPRKRWCEDCQHQGGCRYAGPVSFRDHHVGGLDDGEHLVVFGQARSSTASLVIDEVTMTPLPISIFTWAVVWPF